MFFENFNIPLPKEKIKAKYKNLTEFQCWYRKLTNMALSIFEWEGLPDTCDAWCLEYSLLMYGKACIAKKDIIGLVSLPCQESNMFNIYGYTNKAIAYGFNGDTFEFDCYMPGSDNSGVQGVMLYDNPARFPYSRYIIDGAYRLSDNIRSIDVAVKKLKNPYWIVCNQNQMATVKKSLGDIDNNENAIITSTSLTPDDFRVLPTSTNPQILQGLWDNYNNSYDIIKEVLGINNNEQSDKKERLLTDEVNANNFITDMFLQLRLKQREEFCERVNETFGTKISVGLSETFERFEQSMDNYVMNEGSTLDDNQDEGADSNE